MYPIKNFLQILANLPVSIFLRNTLCIQPKYYKEPKLDSSVSDLFFWRSDKVWRTRFDFLNLPSVLHPDQNISDSITLIFHNQQGQTFHQEKITVPPLQKLIVQVEDLIGDNVGFGSMACFHETSEDLQSIRQTCIVERGFVAYQRLTDNSDLWSYVHGAAYVLAKSPDQEIAQTIRRTLRRNTFYQPQLSFSDCDKFDLIYINPNDRDLEISVRALDLNSQILREESKVLPPRGVTYISFDNKDRAISRVENESRAHMCRPFILKHYETHFDILHG
jgi:hypothetical protein